MIDLYFVRSVWGQESNTTKKEFDDSHSQCALEQGLKVPEVVVVIWYETSIRAIFLPVCHCQYVIPLTRASCCKLSSFLKSFTSLYRGILICGTCQETMFWAKSMKALSSNKYLPFPDSLAVARCFYVLEWNNSHLFQKGIIACN